MKRFTSGEAGGRMNSLAGNVGISVSGGWQRSRTLSGTGSKGFVAADTKMVPEVLKQFLLGAETQGVIARNAVMEESVGKLTYG